MSRFRQFFAPVIPSSNSIAKDSIAIGQRFPESGISKTASRPVVHLFLSLHCRDCLHLLELVAEQAASIGDSLVLYVSNSTAQENEEIRKYCNDAFPVIGVDVETLATVYQVYSTPCAYWTDLNRKVTSFGSVKTIKDLRLRDDEGLIKD